MRTAEALEQIREAADFSLQLAARMRALAAQLPDDSPAAGFAQAAACGFRDAYAELARGHEADIPTALQLFSAAYQIKADVHALVEAVSASR